MSTYQDELMDTDEMDDAESKYFQEVINYDDTADQSSGSFQGSLIVPTFNLESDSFQGNEFQQTMEQSGVKVELSALALQRSQGFQTLDQSTEGQGHCWQTVDTGSEQMIHMLTGGQLTGLGPLSSNSNIQLKLEKSEHTGLETNTGQQDHNNGITVDSASDLFYSNSASASSSGTKRMDMPSNAGLHGSSTFPQTVSKADEVDTISMASTSSGTDGPSLENRSPKRRQKKSKSTAQQGSELLVSLHDSWHEEVFAEGDNF